MDRRIANTSHQRYSSIDHKTVLYHKFISSNSHTKYKIDKSLIILGRAV